MDKLIEHCRVGAITLVELDTGLGPNFVVMDPDLFRVRVFPRSDRGTLTIGIDAEFSNEAPGQFANFTPAYEYASDECTPDDVSITDDGFLSVMVKAGSPRITIRYGWTAQLPRDAVEPIRRAIALAQASASGEDQ